MTAHRGNPVKIAKPYNDSKIEEQVLSVLRSGRLVQGSMVEQFEKKIASYIQCKHVIAVNSGTAALHSSFLALKLAKGGKSEVVTTPLSFAATANAVIHAGCRPVFVDVDPETFNIDPSLVKEKINDKTLAVEPVDVYGLPADLDQIRRIASAKGVPLVEDAAEAIGATYQGKKVGNISTLSCFSTYATKNLHTAEGGFVTTNDDQLAEKLRQIRNQGQASRYNQVILGYNFRMLEMCAVIGLAQVPLIDELNEKRRTNAIYLKERLGKIESISFQRVSDPKDHAWYMFSALLDEKKAGISRDAFVKKLKDSGVEADIAWPSPIHLQPYYQETFGYRKGDYPNAEKICKSIFQLPVQPFLREDELESVILSVKQALQ
ncbi:MAG: DegT/DnrJ/EryC1/StrS family aminotransferase [Nitrososphaerales archaeon]